MHKVFKPNKMTLKNIMSSNIQDCTFTSNQLIFLRLQNLSKGRKAKLQDSLTLHQFYTSIHEEEAWIKYSLTLIFSHIFT